MAAGVTGEAAVRVERAIPAVTVDDEPFWRSGADGVLRMQLCRSCGKFQHPPSPVCFRCLSREVVFQPVSGQATVYTFTINHQQWSPGLAVPFVVIIAELAEQPGLRFASRLIDVEDVSQVHIGMRIAVRFERVEGGLYVPLFAPAGGAE
ncbi:Zn-ribbon domain-containing OB-fold protein [Nocardia sp. CA-135953]|uniref:Zn-ribbon domain-containing OB-fold protein n=1 Tax=Nocardia sp. CA-135953 TaxID=3239978 RepID=UPI003D99E5E7